MFKNCKILSVKRAASLLTVSALAAGLLCGCAPLADPELSSAATSGQDRMVGFYITKEDSYDGGWHQYQDKDGKVYADIDEDAGSYDNISSFPVSGYPCYMEIKYMPDEGEGAYYITSSNTAEGLWDVKTCTHSYSSGDILDEEYDPHKDYLSYSIDAVFHVVPADFWSGADEDDAYLIVNPVYREADGDYYMIAGSGYYCGLGEEGFCELGTVTLSESWTPSDFDQELTSTFSFTCEYYAVPTETQVLQYSADDQLLKTDTWAAGQAPAMLQAEEDTSYLIIKNIGLNADGTESVSTSIVSPEPGADTTYVDDPYEAEDGTVCFNQCEVSW